MQLPIQDLEEVYLIIGEGCVIDTELWYIDKSGLHVDIYFIPSV